MWCRNTLRRASRGSGIPSVFCVQHFLSRWAFAPGLPRDPVIPRPGFHVAAQWDRHLERLPTTRVDAHPGQDLHVSAR